MTAHQVLAVVQSPISVSATACLRHVTLTVMVVNCTMVTDIQRWRAAGMMKMLLSRRSGSAGRVAWLRDA
jgi:hypothetical protein